MAGRSRRSGRSGRSGVGQVGRARGAGGTGAAGRANGATTYDTGFQPAAFRLLAPMCRQLARAGACASLLVLWSTLAMAQQPVRPSTGSRCQCLRPCRRPSRATIRAAPPFAPCVSRLRCVSTAGSTRRSTAPSCRRPTSSRWSRTAASRPPKRPRSGSSSTATTST